ncbi:uncharacterized protein LOC127138003 [Lathyrus oleraceus]|uniref:uncharacterized protein LOC127138003 n=1 Tax=Pisum sativum TaxID=3888 RepID=UPI0021D19A94|nr:uncharacterized protein LOC127138003 [Pisum sativum]
MNIQREGGMLLGYLGSFMARKRKVQNKDQCNANSRVSWRECERLNVSHDRRRARNGKVRARLENASEVLGLLEQVRLGLHPSQAMLLNAALWYGRLGSGNGQFDTTHSKGRGPPTLRLHGQTCHQIGTLLPVQGLPPQYAKLYIFDTEHEVNNIMDCFRENKFVERDVVTKLKSMLDDCNLHAKVFRMLFIPLNFKQGLPHAHILIFIHPQNKYPTLSDIDNIICAEIPYPELHPMLHNLVKEHMIHVSCGLSRVSSPCMKNKKRSKYFPKKFIDDTIVDANGFPFYKRRSNTHVIHKSGTALDNRHVIPYNTTLILKYQAHINMEWCNQSTSIKYILKYIHTGFDRISATIVPSISKTLQDQELVDETKQYLDCSYVSPSEACW